MNILVFVKQVPKEEDLRLDPVTKTLVRPAGGVLSEYDKYAMEAAARLKAEAGGKVTAATMGPPASAEVLRYCLSVGADEVYLLSDGAMGGADAYATVSTLAAAKAYLEKEAPFDLILCGKQARDSDTSLVAPQLAEELAYPQVDFAVDFKYENGELIVSHETDEGLEISAVSAPAVISVSKTVFPARYPNLRLKLKANHTEIPVLSAAELSLSLSEIGVSGSKTTVGASFFPEHGKSGVSVTGESPEEIAEKLLTLLRDGKLI